MCNNLDALYAAMQPIPTVYNIAYERGADSATVTVCETLNWSEVHRTEVSLSVALELLTDASRVSLDGDEVDNFDDVRLAMLHGGVELAAPPTMSLAEAVSELINRAGKGCVITIEGVAWTVA